MLSFILALVTRNVDMKSINDARILKAITFIVTICLVVLIVLVTVLQQYRTWDIIISSSMILIVPTVILTLTFIPNVSSQL